jgi:hypothetical protein
VRLGFTAASPYRALSQLVLRVRATVPDINLVLKVQLQALNGRCIDLALMRTSLALASE